MNSKTKPYPKCLVLDAEDAIDIFIASVKKILKDPADIEELVKQATDAAIDSLETIANGPDLCNIGKLHYRQANLGLLTINLQDERGKLSEHGMTIINEFNVLHLKVFGMIKSLSVHLAEDSTLAMKVFPYYFHRLKNKTIQLSRMH